MGLSQTARRQEVHTHTGAAWIGSCCKGTRCSDKCKQALCRSSKKFTSTWNAESEMRADKKKKKKKVVRSSWAKEERLMKWLAEEGEICAHNQRLWNRMQSLSMYAYFLRRFNNSASRGRNRKMSPFILGFFAFRRFFVLKCVCSILHRCRGERAEGRSSAGSHNAAAAQT